MKSLDSSQRSQLHSARGKQAGLMWVFLHQPDTISGRRSCCSWRFMPQLWFHTNGAGIGKKKKNMSRYSPILLKLSDKVLLNFFILPIFSAGWEAGIRSHIFFSTSTPTLAEGWQRTGCVLEAGKGGPVFRQPCGDFFSPAAARWQTGNGAFHGSHFSNQLVLQMPPWELP